MWFSSFFFFLILLFFFCCCCLVSYIYIVCLMGQFGEAPDIQSNTDLDVVGYFVDKKSVIP